MKLYELSVDFTWFHNTTRKYNSNFYTARNSYSATPPSLTENYIFLKPPDMKPFNRIFLKYRFSPDTGTVPAKVLRFKNYKKQNKGEK